MNFSSKILEDAVNALSSLPGVGKKSALRLALHLVQDHSDKANKISEALINKCCCFSIGEFAIDCVILSYLKCAVF